MIVNVKRVNISTKKGKNDIEKLASGEMEFWKHFISWPSWWLNGVLLCNDSFKYVFMFYIFIDVCYISIKSKAHQLTSIKWSKIVLKTFLKFP